MRVLVIELWGLGDGVVASGVVNKLLTEGHEVGVGCKPVTQQLLARSFSGNVSWHQIHMPWTAHRGKYQVWKWKK